MVKLYLLPEDYEKYKIGEECITHLDRFFESDIELDVNENQIERYSNGGFYAFLKADENISE